MAGAVAALLASAASALRTELRHWLTPRTQPMLVRRHRPLRFGVALSRGSPRVTCQGRPSGVAPAALRFGVRPAGARWRRAGPPVPPARAVARRATAAGHACALRRVARQAARAPLLRFGSLQRIPATLRCPRPPAVGRSRSGVAVPQLRYFAALPRVPARRRPFAAGVDRPQRYASHPCGFPRCPRVTDRRTGHSRPQKAAGSW